MDHDIQMDAPSISTLRDEQSPPPHPHTPHKTSKFRVKLLMSEGSSPSKESPLRHSTHVGGSEEEAEEGEDEEEDQLIDDDDEPSAAFHNTVSSASPAKRKPATKRVSKKRSEGDPVKKDKYRYQHGMSRGGRQS